MKLERKEIMKIQATTKKRIKKSKKKIKSNEEDLKNCYTREAWEYMNE